MQRIIISQPDRDALVRHAEGEEPNESCAILLGRGQRVVEVLPARNEDESPVSFAISDQQLIDWYGLAERKNLEVVGIFHSHPNSDAVPSDTDKKFMRSNPVAWVIYSGVSGKLRAYVLDPDVVEIPIE